MHGLSTILSLLFKLLGKIFRTFGINTILTIFFVIELIACIGYASEMSDYDKNSRDYEFVGVESVVELDRNDPMMKELDILTGENDHYYLVRVKINNRYSERLSVPAMSAETENGDIVIARRITYYGDNMSNHSISTYIPEGTQTVLTYMLDVSGFRLEETNVVKLFDFSGDKNKTLTIELPK
jgi:hypothetical protein